MTPTWRVIRGDVFDVLPTLPEGSVQTVVTSPPYWGLRDYGTAVWEGGDPGCDHAPGPKAARRFTNGRGEGAAGDGYAGSNLTSWTHRDATPRALGCPKGCGARRVDQQLGLETTPEEYVERMVEVFRAVRRVLRDDGTVWLNLGDAYNAGTSAKRQPSVQPSNDVGYWLNAGSMGDKRVNAPRLKPKDLVGIPWRVAFALQADGWYLRSDIIWAKPNPMPESVTDRPTKAHEYVFLLSKSARYFYDAEAVRETSLTGDLRRPYAPGQVDARGNGHDRGGGSLRRVKVPGGWDVDEGSHGTIHRSGRAPATYQDADLRPGRNLRDVWTIPTEPFPEAHFATFPKALVEPCVKAGSRPGDLVLDPFAGSGTVGVVAMRLGRSFVGVELNPEYVEMARRRIIGDGPLLNVPAERMPTGEEGEE